MVRYELKGSPISVAYGSDEISGVFLSVYDDRLANSETAGDEVNAITEKIGVGDGGGSYFDLHTGTSGFGHKVSLNTIRTFLIRYGAKEEHVNSLCPQKATKGIRPLNERVCNLCWKESTKVCVKCKSVFYCSKMCQEEDWPGHKFFCIVSENIEKVLMKPRESTESSVVAVFLPEKSKQPQFVSVLYTKKIDDDGEVSCEVDVDRFLNCGGKVFYDTRNMQVNGRRGCRELKSELTFYFRDTFNFDGSTINECISTLTAHEAPGIWKGPVLVLKHAADGTPKDIQLSDGRDIVDYFLSYGDGCTPTVLSRF